MKGAENVLDIGGRRANATCLLYLARLILKSQKSNGFNSIKQKLLTSSLLVLYNENRNVGIKSTMSRFLQRRNN